MARTLTLDNLPLTRVGVSFLERRAALAAAALLLLLAVQTTLSMSATSFTMDERDFIASGYYTLRTGHFYVNSLHPIFLQAVQALPLLALDLEFPLVEVFQTPPERLDYHQQAIFYLAFFEANGPQLDRIALFARALVVLIAVIGGVFVYRWSKELYGPLAGLLALLLYTFNPNILANAGVATLDTGFTVLILVNLYYLRRLILQPRLSYLLIVGVTLGIILASKVNAPIVVLMYGLFLILTAVNRTPAWDFVRRRVKSRWLASPLSFAASLVAIGFVSLIVLNLAYGFSESFKPLSFYLDALSERPAERDSAEKQARDEQIRARLGPLSGLPVPFPNWYVQATAYQFLHNSGGHTAFLMGEVGDGSGWWYYHTVALVLKTPLGYFALLALWLVYKVRYARFTIEDAFLLIPIVYLMTVVSLGNIKIGIRHILPILPFMFILVSAVMRSVFIHRRWVQIPVAAACVWYIVSSLSVFPHYLAYFNELIGGPQNGYRYLVDSNLEWGQQLKTLKQYMEAEGIESVQLSYTSTVNPALYGVQYESMEFPAPGKEDCAPVGGYIAISATHLQLFPRCYGWLNAYEPIARLGYGLFVYHVPPTAALVSPSPGFGGGREDAVTKPS